MYYFYPPIHPYLYEVALHLFRIVVTKLFPVCNAGFDAVEQLQYDVLGRFICPELTVETPAQRRMRAASDAEPASGQHDAARMSLPSYRGGEPPGELVASPRNSHSQTVSLLNSCSC